MGRIDGRRNANAIPAQKGDSYGAISYPSRCDCADAPGAAAAHAARMDQAADDIDAWLELLHTPQLGAARIRALVGTFGTARAALERRGRGWGEAGISGTDPWVGTNRGVGRAIRRDLDWLRDERCTLLRFTDEHWPALLEQIADPPAALFVWGDVGHLWQPQVAIVGSRHATFGGLEHARNFASGFVARGLTVTSGFARGIDAAAHAAALAAGGSTIAVCGTGLDVDYPRGSAALARAIGARGALVSEHPSGTPPLAGHFPQRNRLISGLSLGTLVVEAGLQSGSLITARLAVDQGREVFAVPGSIRNAQARGCHALIRDGARLVEGAAEVCDALAPMADELAAAIREKLDAGAAEGESGSRQQAVRIGHPASCGSPGAAAPAAETPPSEPVLDAIGFDATSFETLLEAVNLDLPAVSARLLALELSGFIEALPGARYVRLR